MKETMIMEMNTIIMVCAVIWAAAAVFCLFGRSQMIRRVGCMELILTAAVGGCALFGYLKAADFMGKQYHQMMAISLGSAAPYLADLEDELEVYGGSDEAFIQKAEQIVENALPILQSGETQYAHNALFLIKKDEQGVYRERFSAGGGDVCWEDMQAAAEPLIGRAIRSRGAVWQEYEEETTLFAMADPSRIVPTYALFVLISDKPLTQALMELETQYFYYSLLFMAAATLLVALVVLIQEKETHRILRLLSRAAKGREEVSPFLKLAGKSPARRQSNESRALKSSLKQIAINTERMNYGKCQVMQAYYRFAPPEIEKILGKRSILDVAPMDRVRMEGTVAFVSFALKKDLTEEEYLRRMDRNYAFLCEGCRAFGGSIVSGGSNPDVMMILFHGQNRRALQFGIRMAGREMADPMAGQAFVLLHRTQLIYGVAGDEEQMFSYLYSEEIRILQNNADRLRAMGVRMAVTDRVWETEGEDAASRYIGYIEEGQYRFHLYEILDAFPAQERNRRLACRPDFQRALMLYYQSDFYLARNLFSDSLRTCPKDGAARWYLFLCESGLSGDGSKKQSFGLFSET